MTASDFRVKEQIYDVALVENRKVSPLKGPQHFISDLKKQILEVQRQSE